LKTTYWKIISVALVVLVALLGVEAAILAKEVSETNAIRKENEGLKTEIFMLVKENKALKNKITELNNTIFNLQEKIKGLKDREEKVEIIEKTFFGPPYYLIEGKVNVPGFYSEFVKEFDKTIGRGGLLGGYPLVEGVGKYYSQIINNNDILVLSPAGIGEYEELEQKYPEIAPLSAQKLKGLMEEYGAPILYFTKKHSMIRGIIVAYSVDASLADLLLNKGVILNTPFRYENGQIKILK
jgi:cell division protein FtsB